MTTSSHGNKVSNIQKDTPKSNSGHLSHKHHQASNPHSKKAKSKSGRNRVHYDLKQSIFFIGFMGAGKSSVARKLARRLGVTSIDLDSYIERQAGMKIKEIFAQFGEEGFRRIETDVLREIASKDEPMLISCGGGIITQEENREILKSTGFVVYLDVDVDEAASRISNKASRPLFNDIEAAKERYFSRLPYYQECAEIVIDTAGKDIYEIASEVTRVLEQEGLICPRRR